MHDPVLPSLADLQFVADSVGVRWAALRGQSLLITGGTGIIGKWLLATLLHADRRFDLGVRIVAVSRNPGAFQESFPVLGNDKRVSWIRADVRDFSLPEGQQCSHVIHAATDVVASRSPGDVLWTCIDGTRNAILQATRAGATRCLLLSSGAVYGKTPVGFGAIPETFSGAVDCLSPGSAYAEGKRCSELICALENARGTLSTTVARCFAMVGPYVPLDKHFAIGNFIESAMLGRPIIIKGDGTPMRSYLYMADVTYWLWVLLLAGGDGVAYNVGGHEPISIEALARRVASVLGSAAGIKIENVAGHGAHADAYYPDTSRIRSQFGLEPSVGLDEAIARTVAWYRQAGRK